jgi:hypothetical protein
MNRHVLNVLLKLNALTTWVLLAIIYWRSARDPNFHFLSWSVAICGLAGVSLAALHVQKIRMNRRAA